MFPDAEPIPATGVLCGDVRPVIIEQMRLCCASSLPLNAGDVMRITQLGDGSLSIGDVESRDTGVYTCRAYNSVGFDTRSVHLQVVGHDGQWRPRCST